MLVLVKSEIIDLLVRMYIIPKSNLESVAVRRSRRNMPVSDSESDIEIEPTQSRKRAHIEDTTDQDPDVIDGDHVDS